jgi:hypothetical protein
MLNLAPMLIGTLLVLIISAFSFYLVFFPLIRTVAGGFQILAFFRSRKPATQSPSHLSLDPELGLTMADGGEERDKKTD